jgi:hypothetical protein
VGTDIELSEQERIILQHVHRGCKEVLVEKELRKGMSGARVLLILPIMKDGRRAARKVTKLDLALELRQEQANYERYVKDFLPFCAARVENYRQRGDLAGLNYTFVGGGALGKVVDLQEYYRTHTAKQVIKTLEALLDQALGQRYYDQHTPLGCRFADEYNRHMVAHLQLELRPESFDELWPAGQSPGAAAGYQRIAINDIPGKHGSIQPDTLLTIEGLAVAGIKPDAVKLKGPNRQDILVRVKLPPESSMTQGLKLGSIIGVRGRVVHNRRERMEEIVHDIFRRTPLDVDSECIELPGVPGEYPNPLRTYPRVLGKALEGRASFVHGDLHSLNVMVDESGRGWLIDFARVGRQHNLFDFIELETYLRLKELGRIDSPSLPLEEYARFEEALNAATLGQSATPPADPRLRKAYQVILAIRRIAQRYIGPHSDFKKEYFPALSLYCLAMIKYYESDGDQAARLVFTTACVLGKSPTHQIQKRWLLALFLDPCLAAICGWCLLKDQPDLVAHPGAVIIFIGMLVAILTPVFVANRRISLEDVLRRLGTDRRYKYTILGLTVLIVSITLLFWPLGRVGKCRLTTTPIFTSTPTLTETATLTPTGTILLTPTETVSKSVTPLTVIPTVTVALASTLDCRDVRIAYLELDLITGPNQRKDPDESGRVMLTRDEVRNMAALTGQAILTGANAADCTCYWEGRRRVNEDWEPINSNIDCGFLIQIPDEVSAVFLKLEFGGQSHLFTLRVQ